MLRAELQPLAGAALADLDLRRHAGLLRANPSKQAIPAECEDEAGWHSLLLNTEIMVEEGVTMAGVLLFARTPEQIFFRKQGSTPPHFPAVRRTTPRGRRTSLRGPMVPLLAGDRSLVGIRARRAGRRLFVRRSTGVSAVLEDDARRRWSGPSTRPRLSGKLWSTPLSIATIFWAEEYRHRVNDL